MKYICQAFFLGQFLQQHKNYFHNDILLVVTRRMSDSFNKAAVLVSCPPADGINVENDKLCLRFLWTHVKLLLFIIYQGLIGSAMVPSQTQPSQPLLIIIISITNADCNVSANYFRYQYHKPGLTSAGAGRQCRRTPGRCTACPAPTPG